MGSPKQHPTRASALVLTVPGLGTIVRSQAARAGMRPGAVEFDGRSDLITMSAQSWAAIGELRTAEDVLADLGIVPIQRTARATVAQIDLRRVEEAMGSLRTQRLVSTGRAVRVVARMTSERHFQRTALRDEIQHRLLTTPVRDSRPSVELWAIQIRNHLRLGVRLPGVGRRDQPSRPADRPGSLRPAVAAAMVNVADGARAIADPTCGTGTIVLEAVAAGAFAIGGDRDPAALHLSRANGCAHLLQLDARSLPFRADELDAVVANLPFGRQHHVQGAPVAWYRRVLTEALRVAPCAVVLAPPSTPFHQALGRLHVDVQERHDIHLLGRRATIWALTR